MKFLFINEARSQKSEARSPRVGLQPSTFRLQPAQRGVALVITLIMLSVTLVMAIAFLAISRRERNSVSTNTDTTVARLAADSALAAAQVQIVANLLSTNAALYDFGLLVSTNYQNPNGYFIGSQNPTNVNFDFRNVDGFPLNAADFEQNVANLLFLPRAPVAIYNRATGSNEFRFYLDLNRNGRFETNGTTADFDAFNQPTNFTFKVGDPEWVGILERPDAPHGPNNPFVARYAFLAQPIGNALDLNAIHNQVFYQNINPNTFSAVNDGFFRNQGVGSWELNLAGFFADLNTNVWGQTVFPSSQFYEYNLPTTGFANRGFAFDDARALLSYRYSFNYGHLASANFVMGGFANTILPRDNIDTYSDGPLQITTTNINEGIVANQDKPNFSWAGANNPTNFYSLPSELFDPNKVTASFTNRLGSLGSSNASYDRYTFYRLLEQLGTDSSSDDTRMNLNYNNLTATNLAGTVGATNLFDWNALGFFTNAADRLIRLHSANWLAQNYFDYTNTFGATTTQPFALTNIPVYVNGRFVYTPAVNRLLQLAANIYDASTTDVYPSVFRPRFTRDGLNNVYITGFNYIATVTSSADLVFSTPFDAQTFSTVGGSNVAVNVYGVPWILGAKKNLPNFNRFYMLNDVQLTRKVVVARDQVVAWNTQTGGSTHYTTNVAYVMSITNHLGWSYWNSYNTNYAFGPLELVVRDELVMQLSNDAPRVWSSVANFSTPPNFLINNWPGSAWNSSSADWTLKNPQAASFVSTNWNFSFIPEALYNITLKDFQPLAANVADPLSKDFPQFYLRTTNRLQAYLIDSLTKRIVDYVQLDGPSSLRNINNELKDPDANVTGNSKPYMWSTNVVSGNPTTIPNYGVLDQISVSRSGPVPNLPGGGWKSLPNLPAGITGTPGYPEAVYFNAFFAGGVPFYYPANSQNRYYNSNYVQQAAFTPTRTVYEFSMWQVNDPLVHYLSSDLQDGSSTSYFGNSDTGPMPDPDTSLNSLESASGEPPSRYQPWGRAGQLAGTGFPESKYDKNNFNLAYRDSLVWGSDFWDFPTNKYPSAGWLGRVHRGTPWQTVFLKATNVLATTFTSSGGSTSLVGTNTWKVWTGNQNAYDAANAAPEQDRLLFDVFTAMPNDNAARGTLSVNQKELAAWSALLSGVVALTNITDTAEIPSPTSTPIITNTIIPPASVDIANSAVGQIYASILATRANTNLFPLGVFEHAGDILRVPALTEQSPFLNRADNTYLNYDLSDELYEWLPQQTLGLLRLGTPRFVLYCYGQALRPARDGQVLGGNNFGLVTNYQVVAESAVRVVLRVDRHVTATSTNYSTVIESSNPLPPD